MEAESPQHPEMLLGWPLASRSVSAGLLILFRAQSCAAQHPWLLSTPLCRKPVNMTKATVNYRQEKTHMMGAVDRSFTDQSTLQEDERLGLSFMDAHGYSPRGECPALPVALGLLTSDNFCNIPHQT